MRCEKCDQPATIYITEAHHYAASGEHHLCETHAQQFICSEQPKDGAVPVRVNGEVLFEIGRVIISEQHDPQVLVFREVGGSRSFPIVCGVFEATSIDRRLKGMTSPRPLTHDALAATITAMGGKLREVAIDDLREHTYFAKLRIVQGNGRVVEVDVRPSDAAAMAVTFGVPIFIPEQLLGEMMGA